MNPGCFQPRSSAMMKTMFGFAGGAVGAATEGPASTHKRPKSTEAGRGRDFIRSETKGAEWLSERPAGLPPGKKNLGGRGRSPKRSVR